MSPSMKWMLLVVTCCLMSCSMTLVSGGGHVLDAAVDLDLNLELEQEAPKLDLHHVSVQLPQSPEELAWLAKPVHTQEEKQAFLTAFQIATAVSEDIDVNYENSLLPHHSFFERSGVSLEQEAQLVESAIKDWSEEAALSHHSFAEIASLHSADSESELLSEFESKSDDQIMAELENEVKWPGFISHIAHAVAHDVGKVAHAVKKDVGKVAHAVKKDVGKVAHAASRIEHKVGHAIAKGAKAVGHEAMRDLKVAGKGLNKGIQLANKGVNAVGKGLDKAQQLTTKGLMKVTKMTHTQFLDGAIKAGVGAAFTMGPLGEFRAVQAGLNSAAAVSGAIASGKGLKGAINAGKSAMISAARNYVMSKIPVAKVLEHAMKGPLGEMVRKSGRSILDTPIAKNLLAKAHKAMAGRLMQTPLARNLVKTVQAKNAMLLESGKEHALSYINNKVEDKTGLNLGLGGKKSKKGGAYKPLDIKGKFKQARSIGVKGLTKQAGGYVKAQAAGVKAEAIAQLKASPKAIQAAGINKLNELTAGFGVPGFHLKNGAEGGLPSRTVTPLAANLDDAIKQMYAPTISAIRQQVASNLAAIPGRNATAVANSDDSHESSASDSIAAQATNPSPAATDDAPIDNFAGLQ